MDAQDVNQVIALVPTRQAVLQSSLAAGTLAPTGGSLGLRFEVATGTLDDSVYDLFRPSDYILSCVRSSGGTDLAYVTRKVIKTPPSGRCYHATVAANLPSIRSSGLILGRNVPRATARAGIYPDSKQYIHAALTEFQAVEFWYYDRLGNDQAGVVLEIDLFAAGIALFADPRSDDGVVGAIRISPSHITNVTPLPSVADMQAFLLSQGWICRESGATNTVSGTLKGLPALTSGYSLPGAWRVFYLRVKNGTLP